MARKELTPEEKAKRAENLKKAREAKKARDEEKKAAETSTDILVNEENAASENKTPVSAKYEATEVSEADALREQNKLLLDKLMEMEKKVESLSHNSIASPQVVKVSTEEEKVHFLWQAEVSDDNIVLFGDGGIYGRIVGKTGSFFIPKSEISRILDSMNRYFIEKRWLIIVSGLNDEERETLGANYREGEILDQRAFAKMVDLKEEILSIYPELCDGHKEMVAKRYYEEYMNGNPNVTREIVVELNRLSKVRNPNGDFVSIIERMNAEDLK